MEDGVTDLTLDLSRTALLDATGVALLLAAANSYRGGDRCFALVALPPAILALLEMLRISQRLGARIG